LKSPFLPRARFSICICDARAEYRVSWLSFARKAAI
jgi:hypothetical protein